MSRVRIDMGGVREYLRSPGVTQMVDVAARGVAERANGLARFHSEFRMPAYRSAVYQGKYTAVGVVAGNRLGSGGTGADPVRAENAKHNTLLKAIGGAR